MDTRSSGLSWGLTVLIGVLCMLPAVSWGETYVAGPVAGRWTRAGSPYIATAPLDVLASDTLRIESGVEVLFEGPYSFQVHGRLQAVGAESDSVRMRPLGAGGTWQGVRFFDAADNCCLTHCCLTGGLVEGSTVATGCGGAVFSDNSSPVVSHCRIAECRSSTNGSLLDGGGGIYCRGGEPRILYNLIQDCRCNAFCTGGGGGVCFRDSQVDLIGNRIIDCHAHGLGGGVAGIASTVRMEHNVIAQCSGLHYGGGIGLREGCSGKIFGNLVVANAAPDICGGGIYLLDCDVEISWCTIADNTAGSMPGSGTGGGLYVQGPEPTVCDCIFWGNEAAGSPQIHPGGLSAVTYCDVQGGYPGAGNFGADPRFCASLIDSVYDGYFLSAISAGQGVNSPCIDTGHLPASAAGLDRRTTRTDLEPDQGAADLGFHYGRSDLSGVEPLAGPGALRLRVSPNPSQGQAVIVYAHGADPAGPMRLSIFDACGRLVRVLRSGVGHSGAAFAWDGRDAQEFPAPPGLYFLRISAGPTGPSYAAKLVRSR